MRHRNKQGPQSAEETVRDGHREARLTVRKRDERKFSFLSVERRAVDHS